MAVYDLVDAQNTRARGIAEAVDDDRLEVALELRQAEAPLRMLNEILRLSSIPIEISLRSNEELLASKMGSPKYSIAELSDGERNVLLIASSVLTAKPGTLLLIDEPERHIHRSISARLLTLLFARRRDCAFVVSTHDVMLPLDNPNARTLLLRSCLHAAGSDIAWDADLLDAPIQLEETLFRDILGARRRVLFVEGNERSLDVALYGLLFPDVSVVAKASCRDVEHAVTGIREAESLHWVRAFGIVDGDAREADDLERLRAKGIYPLDVFSVESIYYHPEIQRRVATRHAAVTGVDAGTRLEEAKQSALNAIASQKSRLSERVAEKALREVVFRALPRREEVAAGRPIVVNVDVAATVTAELNRLESALAAGDVLALIIRYPVRETSALAEIASRLGFQNRVQYEGAVRKLLLEDVEAVAFLKSLFGTLCEDIC